MINHGAGAFEEQSVMTTPVAGRPETLQLSKLLAERRPSEESQSAKCRKPVSSKFWRTRASGSYEVTVDSVAQFRFRETRGFRA